MKRFSRVIAREAGNCRRRLGEIGETAALPGPCDSRLGGRAGERLLLDRSKHTHHHPERHQIGRAAQASWPVPRDSSATTHWRPYCERPKLLKHKPPVSQRKPVSIPPTGSSSSKTKWLLHPSVPVDVRVAGALAAGAGGLYLYSWLGRETKVEEVGPSEEISVETNLEHDESVTTVLDNALPEPTGGEEEEVVLIRESAEGASDSISTDAAPSQQAQSEASRGEEEEEIPQAAASESDAGATEEALARAEAEPEPVDPAQTELVANLLQDVLTGKVVEDMAPLAEDVSEGKTSSAPTPAVESDGQETTTQVAPEPAAEAAPPMEAAPPIEDLPNLQERAKEEKVFESSAREVEVAGEPKPLEAAADGSPQAAAPPPPPPVADEKETSALAAQPPAALSQALEEKKASFDPSVISETMEPQNLVARAVAKGEDPGENWELYGAMHRQAAHDAETFNAIMMSLITQYEEEIDDVIMDLKRADEDKRALESDLRKMVARHSEDLRTKAAEARLDMLEGIRKHREEDLRATAQAMVRERQIRLRELDETRMKLNSLKMAFGKRSDQAKLSSDSHRLTRAVLSIKDRTEEGRPFSEALDSLSPVAKDDDLIALVISSVPKKAARDGVLTSTQLQRWFWSLEKEAAKVALLPEQGAGILSQILSRFAALVRVREASTTVTDTAGNGPKLATESTLSAARALIADGKFLECAALLERELGGTAALAVVREWIEAAREREKVDQAVMVLEASARTKAASLS